MLKAKEIIVVGLGGAGARIVESAASSMMDRPSVIAIDSDENALSLSGIATKLQIGASITEGMGTGGDVTSGRRSATSDEMLLSNIMTDASMLLLVTGLGGGLGTGAAPFVLKQARKAGMLTVCVATLPFPFEGPDRQAVAIEGIDHIEEHADALVLVHNDKLAEFSSESSLASAFERGDEILRSSLRGVWRMLTRPGYIELGIEEMQRSFEQTRGACALGYGMGYGMTKAKDAIASLIDGPLLNHGMILSEAESVVVSIAGGRDLALMEITEIMEAVTAKAKRGAKISLGTIIDENLSGSIYITLLASERIISAPSGVRAAGAGASEGGRRRRRKSAVQQDKLKFKDKFDKVVAPTIMEGENLDIPTFKRRGIEIER